MSRTKRTTGSSNGQPKAEPMLMAEKEAAELLGFSVRTLQTWRSRGGGPPFIRVSARCIRYRREDLETWVEENKRLSTSDPGRPVLPARVDHEEPLPAED